MSFFCSHKFTQYILQKYFYDCKFQLLNVDEIEYVFNQQIIKIYTCKLHFSKSSWK